MLNHSGEQEDILTQPKLPLPNSTAALVLGICSVVFGCIAIGLFLGIIGLVLASRGKKMYRAQPFSYTGYNNLQAGFILSVIGVCIGGLALLYYIFIGVLVATHGPLSVH